MAPARLRRVSVIAIAAALVLSACGEDDDSKSADSGPETTTEVVESDGELPAEIAREVEAICGRMVIGIGSLAGDESEDQAAEIDRIQDGAQDDLAALSDGIPEPQRPAWDAYLAAQEEAFALSPPPTAGEPQPELDAANAAAEAQAAELGFASCSSV